MELEEIENKKLLFEQTGSCCPEKEFYKDSYTQELVSIEETNNQITREVKKYQHKLETNKPKFLTCLNCNAEANYPKDKGYNGVICPKCRFSWNPNINPTFKQKVAKKPFKSFKEFMANKQEIAKDNEINDNIKTIQKGGKISLSY